MSRCKEKAGLLFPRPCEAAARAACARCHKPVCATHLRQAQGQPTCVGCVRADLRERQHRGSYAHLRDDPYFFWYFDQEQWFGESFTAEDYALFDGGAQAVDLDADLQSDWEGS